jgi:hypothetical protein
MKINLAFLFCVSVFLINAQIPVTDVATNTSVAIANKQLTNINLQLKMVNNNLLTLIHLMEENNNETSQSKEILKEELDAKKTSPDFVMESTDVRMTLNLKDKILEIYRASQKNIRDLEYLEQTELQEFTAFTARTILEAKSLFQQCNRIIKTKSLILPEERLKKVYSINSELEQLLNGLMDYNDRLSQTNNFRKARLSLININRN